MTTPTPNTQEQDAPIIPPVLFLGITAVALVVGVLAFLTGQEPVISLGALGFGVISLVAWAILNPQEAVAILTGRSVSFGLTAVVVLALVIAASGILYAGVASQNWQADLTGSNQFTLNPDLRQIIETLAADPTTPEVRIIGFFGLQEALRRDQVELLLQGFDDAGGDTISYEFIDPDRAPRALENYGAQIGQLAVVRVDAETGEPVVEDAQVISSTGQQVQFFIADAIITATASGDYRAYFLRLDDGISIADNTGQGAQILATELRDRFRWTVEEVGVPTLISEMAEAGDDVAVDVAQTSATEDIDLLDPAADGEVLVIPGGVTPLPQEAITALERYVAQGGNLVIFGQADGDPDAASLVTDEAMDDFLVENFGVRVLDQIIIDPAVLRFGQIGANASDFAAHPINEEYSAGSFEMQLGLAHPIEILGNATAIASTSAESYAKDGLDLSVVETIEELQQDEDDLQGPLPVVVAAEDDDSGARLVVFGNPSPLLNSGVGSVNLGIVNFLTAQNSLFWAMNYENAASALSNIPQISNPADAPMNITNPNAVGTVNLVSLLLVPFGVLFGGVAIWWFRRESLTNE